MRFTESTISKINDNSDRKKKENPYKSRTIIGIGVNLRDSIGGATVFKDNFSVCTVDELGRMIEELTMLKQAIEEETGLIL